MLHYFALISFHFFFLQTQPAASAATQQVELVLSPELGGFIVEFMKCVLFHWVMLTIGRFF